VSAAQLASIVPGATPALARELVDELNAGWREQGRAVEIWEVAGGYQLRTRPEYKGYLQQLEKDRPLRLSRASLETLAVVAYKQPATRAEIEHVRGVDVGAVLRSLVERKLVRIAGHREVPGRPIVYGTTKRFLEVFGLGALSDLPTLREIQELVPNPPAPEADDEAAPAHAALDGGAGAPPHEIAPGAGIDDEEDEGEWEETLH
jgi:segregation and condensation protein B